MNALEIRRRLLLGSVPPEYILTKEGVPPLSFNSNGKPLLSYEIAGNTVRESGVGDRTAQLFDASDYIADNVAKFACHMTEGVRYTASNESGNTVRIKVGRHRDDYSSVDVVIEPQGKSTFTMTRNPNVPASATLYIMIRVDGVWVTEPSQIEDILIMLCEGAERMPYEEYGYKIPIVCSTGKNLWDEKSKAGYYSSSGVWSYADNQICTENYIKVKPNTQYWLGVPYERQRGSLGILLYDENKEFLRRENSDFYLGSGTAYTTQADTYFIKLNFGAYYKTAYENDIIVAESDTEVPYEPYREPISIPNYIASPLMSGEILKSDGTISRADGTTEHFEATEIPTFRGMNTLTVDTEVQPSNVKIEYRSSRKG